MQHPRYDSTPVGHPRSVVCATRPQVLRAAAPAATMLIEVVIKRKPQKPLMVLAVVCVSAGPVLTQLGSSIDGSVVGVAMQLAAVFGSACKSVFGHAILTQHKKKLGLLSFLFWAEWFTAAMLLPWATLNGELADMWCVDPTSCARLVTALTARPTLCPRRPSHPSPPCRFPLLQVHPAPCE